MLFHGTEIKPARNDRFYYCYRLTGRFVECARGYSPLLPLADYVFIPLYLNLILKLSLLHYPTRDVQRRPRTAGARSLGSLSSL